MVPRWSRWVRYVPHQLNRCAAQRAKNGRDDSIFDYLTEERDPSGFKYRIPFPVQVELFRYTIGKTH